MPGKVAVTPASLGYLLLVVKTLLSMTKPQDRNGNRNLKRDPQYAPFMDTPNSPGVCCIVAASSNKTKTKPHQAVILGLRVPLWCAMYMYTQPYHLLCFNMILLQNHFPQYHPKITISTEIIRLNHQHDLLLSSLW